MHVIDIYYFKGVNYHINTNSMHDLKSNFDKILPLVKQTLADQLNEDGNLQYYPRKPHLSDLHIISLALLAEALGIDSERLLWSKLQTDYADLFPNLPHRSNYNRRRKRMAGWIEQLARRWGRQIRPDEDTYLVDSIPVPVAHVAREHSTRVCREQFHSAPDKGYSAVFEQYYIGYKLHLVISLDGTYHSMDMSKASVHDVHFLGDIKHGRLANCLLLADKGYLSHARQMDLFETCGIDLHTPMRRNQKNFKPWPGIFKTARRRIETVFSQLCDQLMLKRNYAKTFAGLRSRLINKVASLTLLQYINWKNDQPINHIKHALAV